MKPSVLAACAVLCFPLSAWPQSPPSATPDPNASIREYLANPFAIRVRLELLREKEQPTLAADVRAMLRALPNVMIVTDKPDVTLMLLDTPPSKNYSCAMVVLRPANEWFVTDLALHLHEKLGPKGVTMETISLACYWLHQRAKTLPATYTVAEAGTFYGGEPKEVLENAVKVFDTKHLEPLRQDDQKFRDEMRADLNH